MNGKKNGKRRLVVVLAILFCAALIQTWRLSCEENKHEGLIRFHVQANSDSPADQAVKYQVRDSIIKAMAEKFGQVNDVAQARRIAEQNLYYMQQLAVQEIRMAGKDYPAKVELGNFDFPVKRYHNNFCNVILPAGKYEAVRVVLGQGAGANWWCVLFPPLCFFDPGSIAPTEKRDIKKVYEKKDGHEIDTNCGGEDFEINGYQNTPEDKGAGYETTGNGARGQENSDQATPAFQLKTPQAIIALGSIKRNENAWIMTSENQSVEFRFKILEAVQHSCDWFNHTIRHINFR